MIATIEPTTFAPRTIYDENGLWSGVILSAADYQALLRFLADHADWEMLPAYLQDAVDNMLADEVENANEPFISLEEFLAEE